MKIKIGTAGRQTATIDLGKLLVTRALIQASSGGGKSHTLRRFIEQVFGHVQVIVIDPEGEFGTLREKFDFVLAAKGGDTPADVRSAKLLATRLLELRASAVCDLYELPPAARHQWVHDFLESVMNAEKKLWHPLIIVVDEAHKFCPEKGAGESAAKEQMLALVSAGRKRGFCAVWATQRLSKLSKDAAAELLNKMVGRTSLADDRTRAADELGVPTKKAERDPFDHALLTLKPGQFYMMGPAIGDEAKLIQVGDVQTTHPEPGATSAAPAPPTDKVKSLLPRLEDLPKEAEEKAQSERQMRATIAELKRELREAQKVQPAPAAAAPASTKKDEREIQRRVEAAVKEQRKADADELARQAADARDHAQKVLEEVAVRFEQMLNLITNELADVDKLVSHKIPRIPIDKGGILRRPIAIVPAPVRHMSVAAGMEAARARRTPTKGSESRAGTSTAAAAPSSAETLGGAAAGDVKISSSQARILRTLAEFEALSRPQMKKAAVAAFSGASVTSSTFTNNLGALRTAGLVEYPAPGMVQLTASGRAAAGRVDPPADEAELLRRVTDVLSASQAKILAVLHERGGQALLKSELAALVGASASSSTFTNNLGALRTAGIIDYPTPGSAAVQEWLYL